MNIERLIQMVLRMGMAHGVQLALRKGTQLLAGRGKRAEDMSAEERASAASMQRRGNQARQMLRMGRRLR